MALNFNLDGIRSTAFGVGRDEEDGESFLLIPVDAEVQNALKEMAGETWEAMSEYGDPDEYQPSEKHASQEYLITEVDSDWTTRLRDLHHANNLQLGTGALEEPSDVFCYFARFSDSRDRRLTAVRRATQFKGLLKSRNRLLRIVDDTLQIVEDKTFKLDSDFDLLIDSTYIHILRPSGFEFIAELQEAIRDAVPDNVAFIQRDIPYVNFAGIQEYASSHTRAARLLASIRSQRETQNVSQRLLRNVCRTHGVDVQVRNGTITISAGHEMTFLDILDRRMYELELVEGAREQYKAGSRRRVAIQAR
jgi:hypothetical protein